MAQHQAIGLALTLRKRYLDRHTSIIHWLKCQRSRYHNCDFILIYQLYLWLSLSSDRHFVQLQRSIAIFALYPLVLSQLTLRDFILDSPQYVGQHICIHFTPSQLLNRVERKLKAFIQSVLDDNVIKSFTEISK